MENLSNRCMNEVKILKERLKITEDERDEAKVGLHIVTVHCCNLIAEKEGRKFEDVKKEINENMHKIMHG